MKRNNLFIIKTKDMKIKLLAASVLFLALGITIAEAQSTQSKERNQFGQKDRRGGENSKTDKWDKTKKDGKFRKGGGKYKSDKMSKNRHGKELRKYKKHNRRNHFQKRHGRTHRF